MKKLFRQNTISVAIILGISHGVADAAAGFLLGNLSIIGSLEKASLLIILYNFIGFGYQPLVGMLTDRIKKPRLAIIFGLLFLAAALLAVTAFALPPTLAVIIAGIGSAAFHVGGGAMALNATPHSTVAPGLFAAPGVIGLAIGGALGITGYGGVLLTTQILVLMLIVTSSWVALTKFTPFPYPKQSLPSGIFAGEEDDTIMLVLLSAIALTSTVWTSFQFFFQKHLDFTLLMAVAAAMGKVVGGILAQQWGWRLWTVSSLSLATLLFAFGGQNLLTLLPSLALLQSSIPITLAATARLMPQQPATASGFALGLGIILGGIPLLGGLSHWFSTAAIAALLVMAVTMLLGWILKPSLWVGDKRNS